MHETERDLIRSKVRLPVSPGQQLLASNQLFQAFFPDGLIGAIYGFVQHSPLVNATITASVDQQSGKLQGVATMEGNYISEILFDEFGHPLPEDQQYPPTPFRIEANFDQGELLGNYTLYTYDADNPALLFSVVQVYVVYDIVRFSLYVSLDEVILNLGGTTDLWLRTASASYNDARQFFAAYPILSPDNQLRTISDQSNPEELESVWQQKILVASHLADHVSIR